MWVSREEYNKMQEEMRELERRINTINEIIYYDGFWSFNSDKYKWIFNKGKLSVREVINDILDKLNLKFGKVEIEASEIGLVNKKKENKK